MGTTTIVVAIVMMVVFLLIACLIAWEQRSLHIKHLEERLRVINNLATIDAEGFDVRFLLRLIKTQCQMGLYHSNSAHNQD